MAHGCVQLNWITFMPSECVLQGLVQLWWEPPSTVVSSINSQSKCVSTFS